MSEYCPFVVGEKVVCVRLGGRGYGCEVKPVVGGVYTVRELISLNGEAQIRLVEIVNDVLHYKEGRIEAAWAAYRFRPLVERKTEAGMAVLRSILTNAPSRISEDA